jgi:hypothetical protein
MTKTVKPRRLPLGSYIIEREDFAKISAVEGIKLGRRVVEDFKDFDRRGLSAAERRRELTRKYGRKS